MATQQYKNSYNSNTLVSQERAKNNKYCFFKKNNIRYIDYKNPDFLLRFVNEQGKMYPRRITGTSLKMQKRLTKAIKKARHMALLPFVSDSLK
jgi:small subunit ribosomal protein S18